MNTIPMKTKLAINAFMAIAVVCTKITCATNRNELKARQMLAHRVKTLSVNEKLFEDIDDTKYTNKLRRWLNVMIDDAEKHGRKKFGWSDATVKWIKMETEQ